MKLFIYCFYLFIIPFCSLSAQLNANSVLTLRKVTTIEMNAIVTPNTGSMIFNTDDEGVYKFDGSNWARLLDAESSLQSVLLDSGNGTYTLDTATDTYFNLPVGVSEIQSIDNDVFEVIDDGTIRVLEDGLYLISAELSTSNLPSGDRKYIIGVFLNGTANPGNIIAYLSRGFASLPSTDWWGTTGVLTYNLSANDVVRVRYVLNSGVSSVTGRFTNLTVTKIK